MKFKHSVIGVNTAENREWLESIGYDRYIDSGIKGVYIKTQSNGMYYLHNKCHGWSNNVVDCITNSPLFRAVSAIRDDLDYMQWFVDPCGYWHFNPGLMDGMRKATLEELKEHFKD